MWSWVVPEDCRWREGAGLDQGAAGGLRKEKHYFSATSLGRVLFLATKKEHSKFKPQFKNLILQL